MFVLFAILIFVYHAASEFVVLQGEQLSIVAQYAYQVLFIWGAGLLLRKEIREHKAEPLYCEGFLLQTGWLVVIPYYMIKSRGVKGILAVAILVGTAFVARAGVVIIHAVSTSLTGR
jgi:hypothetical protein